MRALLSRRRGLAHIDSVEPGVSGKLAHASDVSVRGPAGSPSSRSPRCAPRSCRPRFVSVTTRSQVTKTKSLIEMHREYIPRIRVRLRVSRSRSHVS